MKKIYLIFISVISLFLSSCRPLDYGDKYENVRWTSTYPNIEFTVYNKIDGFNNGEINTEENKIEILCMWTLTNSLELYYKDKLEESLKISNSISWDDLAIKGQYKIWRNQGVVKMHVDLDNVFDYKYEYITFVMSEL